MDLFFNLVHRVYFYYDNSDGVLSDELIARKAYDVMNYTEFDAMEFKSLDTGKVTTSPGYCREHGVSRRSYSRKALMYQNYESIQAWYEPGEICYLKPEGSARQRAYRQSVYTRRYCKFNNIPVNPGHCNISEWYNPAVSVRLNLQTARA